MILYIAYQKTSFKKLFFAEVCVSYVVDEFKKPRTSTTVIIAVIILLLGVPSSLTQRIWYDFTIFGFNFFDFMDYVSGKILLPLDGLLLCIFVGWVWKPKNTLREITNEGQLKFPLAGLWTALIKYVVPVIIFIILLTSSGILKL